MLVLGNQWASQFQGVAPGTQLLDATKGQFNRTSPATYQTGAATVVLAASDVLRLEDTGDGHGALPLIEGYRLNWFDTNEGANFLATGAGWAAVSSATATPANATAPDGTLTASTLNFIANNNSRFQRNHSNPLPPPSVVVTYSTWFQSGTAPNTVRCGYIDKDTTTFRIVDVTCTATWQRASVNNITLSASTGVLLQIYQQFPGSGAHSVVLWGCQLESSFGNAPARYPTSFMPNPAGGSNVFRNPDVLQFQASQVPYQLRAKAWQQPIYPKYANTELADGDERWLYSFGSLNDGIRIRRAAGATKVEAVVGGAVKAASAALTFAENAQLLIKSDGPNGIISVNGAAGPTGTAYAWPRNVPVRQGGIVSDLQSLTEIDARMGVLVAA
jgi:hypothetical protein